jgi:hypothetical protein
MAVTKIGPSRDTMREQSGMLMHPDPRPSLLEKIGHDILPKTIDYQETEESLLEKEGKASD